MNQPNSQTNPIESVMITGSNVQVTLKIGNAITGSFYGFLPTKDQTFMIVLHSDLAVTNHHMIPMDNIATINFIQKLSSLIN